MIIIILESVNGNISRLNLFRGTVCVISSVTESPLLVKRQLVKVQTLYVTLSVLLIFWMIPLNLLWSYGNITYYSPKSFMSCKNRK
jgi:hypothetical protein